MKIGIRNEFMYVVEAGNTKRWLPCIRWKGGADGGVVLNDSEIQQDVVISRVVCRVCSSVAFDGNLHTLEGAMTAMREAIIKEYRGQIYLELFDGRRQTREALINSNGN